MAKGKGGGGNGLKISIGLRYDELNQDFVDVEQTISENIQRLNRQNNLIDIKSQISLVGITDEAKKLDIIQSKLKEQIELQRNKVILYEDAANQQVKLHGTESKTAQNAIYAYHQQRLALAKLTQQLNDVNAKQKEIGQSGKIKNSLLSGYTSLKGDVSGAIGNLANSFNGLKIASQSADGAITKSLDIIGSIPHPAGKAVAALASIPLVVKGIESSLLDMARPAISAGDSMYVMSRGMQISVKDMAQLSMVSQVTGIEVNEVNSSLRRLSASITKADEKGNLASRTLQKYGASIKDANGNIKQGTALVGELAKAFSNARALGKGAEFRDAVGGRFWSADFVTFLEDYADNIKLAGKVVKNGLADPKLAHSIQGEMNALNAQSKQLNGAWSSAFMPVANHIVPHLRQRLGELTRVINEHSEGIKNAGYRIGEVVDKVGEFTTNVIKAGVVVADFFDKTGTPPDSAIVDKYLDKNNKDFKELQDRLAEYSTLQLKIEELQEKSNKAKSSGNNAEFESLTTQIQELSQKAGQAKFAVNNIVSDKLTQSLSQGTQAAMRYNKAVGYYGTLEIKRQADSMRIANQLLEENTQNVREATTAVREKAKAEKEAKKAAQELNDAESPERIKKYADELSKLNLDLKFGDNNYQKSLAELEQWHKDSIAKAAKNWEERIEVEKLYKAKLEKLRQEPEKNVSDLTKEAANIEFERTHTAFEKQLRDIQQWRDAQLKKANTAKEVAAIIKNSAEKESAAFETELSKIKGKVQNLHEKIFEQEHSKRANKAMQLQKERFELYNAGIYDPEDIERFYRNAAKKERLGKWANIDLYSQIQEQTNADMLRFGNAPSPKQTNISAPDFKNLSQDFQTKLAAPIQIVSDSAKQLNISVGNVGGSFKSASSSAILLANTFQDVSKRISNLKISPPNNDNPNKTPTKGLQPPNIPTKNLQPPTKSDNPLQPPKQSNDNTADKLKLAAQKVSGNSAGDLTKNFSKDLTGITKQLADLTKIVGSIAQDSAKNLQAKPPQITVSPNININLGGAYVFDNALKAQLTDDITTDVANAITEAIDSAAVKFNTSYSN